MLTKTRSTAALVEELIDRSASQAPGDRALLEAVVSGYLAAVAYAEVERTVETILTNRFQEINDEKVSNFIAETWGKKQGRISKSDIANLAKQFGDQCKAQFNNTIDAQHETFYYNLLKCRHDLAHGEPRNETLLTAKNGIIAAEKLLEALEQSIKQ
ncbi:hypothetical protein GFB49_05560 [Epibacterium sp. SM1979]|uniref:RiboL-PSP-HEPN domain-containing protein n=1 Tax=Tritonibacter litoralis TaxID=2662264 RepID=A0A843YF62_9RHOB|nr:HEPN domain-containing protein [Tritonibacter litoralis]MQQ07913.1 hypothetical protein [Tritonibacter litoralis]